MGKARLGHSHHDQQFILDVKEQPNVVIPQLGQTLTMGMAPIPLTPTVSPHQVIEYIDRPVEVIKYVEVPVEKIIEKEVIKEVQIDVIKYIEKPVETVLYVDKPVLEIRDRVEYIKYVPFSLKVIAVIESMILVLMVLNKYI